MWGSITNPYFSDNDNSKTEIHLTHGTFKMTDPLDNGFNIETVSYTHLTLPTKA